MTWPASTRSLVSRVSMYAEGHHDGGLAMHLRVASPALLLDIFQLAVHDVWECLNERLRVILGSTEALRVMSMINCCPSLASCMQKK